MGAWTHVVGTYDGSQLKIYFNGNLDGQVSATGNIVATNQNVVIGADTAGGGENFNGSIDEVRISNSARSADWIATEYKNQSSPSTFYSVGSAAQGTMSLSITGLSPSTANPGEAVVIQGTNFAATQGGSTLSLNGTSLAVLSWSDTAINVIVPFGAAAGYFTVTVNGQTAVSPIFTLRRIPLGWSDGDVGTVGKAGSAGYASGTFTVKGAGQGMTGSADQLHYLYQPLSGDGTIVARVASMQGGNYPQAGVMIRESLDAGAANIYPAYYYTSYMYVFQRASTGASSTGANYVYTPLPYWVKVTRNGNTFSSYASGDGVNWAQMGTSQTITMAQNAYIGLAVSSGSTTVLTTATFDNVSVSSTAAPAPVITSVSATTGSIGSQVLISGSGFGASQGGSGVTLNRAPVTINSWSNTSITITIPSGATSGPLLVTLAPSMNDSNAVEFTVTTQPLPSSWLDQDVGTVGTSGSASYPTGTFTVAGSGQGLNANADGLHFVYQPLSGDGTIVARLASLQGSVAQAGVMIRETLDPGATLVSEIYNRYFSYFMLYERPTTGASISAQNGAYSTTLPYWLKLVRSGSTFTGYTSTDGVNWVQSGTSVTVSMAQNVYIGLMVSSTYTATLATATFDTVSISSTASPAPAITAVSTTTGSVGSQVLITGTGFRASQGGSEVEINNTPMTINSWSNTSIVFTIPSGASSGPLLVSVAPSMNDSNVVAFTVTSHPLLTPWLDRDIGSVGIVGSASYSNGTFTVNAAGQGFQTGTTADSFHFVYQPLAGDGTIVARVVSFSSPNSSATAGVMIRETLDPGSTNADTGYWAWYKSIYFEARVATGAANSYSNGMAGSPPYWVKVVRTGSMFSGYASLDAVNWVQVGTSQTISMAQNVYVGLVVSNGVNTALGAATFDSVSISSTAAPAPVITRISATTGSVGSQLVITGTGFGASEGSSLVLLNSASATINSWSNTSITITIPAGATSGPLLVSVAPSMNDSNAVNFTVSSQPLLIPWVDQDIGLVGIAGSASYANGTFTVKGAGPGTYNTSDGFHFVYQTLSGDGTIVARVTSLQGSNSMSAGVMIRETLDPAARSAFEAYYASCCIYLWARTSPGTSAFNQADVSVSLPYWVKLIRSGSAFSTYGSTDGAAWTQLGSTVTIAMAQSVYVGLAVSNGSTSALATATFDNVSLTVGSTPFVTGVSPSVGGTGTAVTIAGSNFGTTPGDSTVSFNGALAASITSWSSTQIVANVSSA